MAQLEIIALDEAGNELEAPQGADTYVAKSAVHLEQPLTTDSTIDGRNVAADGALAASATQPGDNISDLVNDAGYEANVALASQAEAEAGVENTKTMTALRVAQAIAILAAGIQNNYTAITDPGTTNDNTEGYAPGSYWINTVSDEVYRCVDATTNLAVWVITTLSSDDLAAVALSGDSDDLIEGTVKLLLTVAERAKLGHLTVTQAVDLDTLEASVATLSGLFAVVDSITAYAGGGQANAVELSEGTNIVEVVATAADSVKMPAAASGKRVTIQNRGAEYMDLFPAVGDELMHFAVNIAIPISPNGVVKLQAIDSTHWISV